jgi:hypothetical protein
MGQFALLVLDQALMARSGDRTLLQLDAELERTDLTRDGLNDGAVREPRLG